MRNFANKIWNIGRFIYTYESTVQASATRSAGKADVQEALRKEFAVLRKKYMKDMAKYLFSQSLNDIHEFMWHRFADYYIEELKEELKNGNISVLERLKEVYIESLKMLHPFMPFVTEAAGQVFLGKDTSLLQIGF
jgi:valyl-tRNA synthetase